MSVTDSNHKQQPFDQHLAFVRYYCDKAGVPGHQKARDLNMQHLVWKESKGMHRRRQCKTPSYAVIDVASIVQKVCICPHFACGQSLTLSQTASYWLMFWTCGQNVTASPGMNSSSNSGNSSSSSSQGATSISVSCSSSTLQHHLCQHRRRSKQCAKAQLCRMRDLTAYYNISVTICCPRVQGVFQVHFDEQVCCNIAVV